jgi:hypothetical protein
MSVNRIVNVYNPTYKGIPTPGIGDYLRGCCFVYQVCKSLNIDFDMHFKGHPISKYLVCDNQIEKHKDIDYDNIEFYSEHNNTPLNVICNKVNNINYTNKFINYCNNNCNNLTKSTYIFNNSFPVNNVSYECYKTIREKLEPTNEMKQYIRQTMFNLKISPKKYNVIHIRTGDKYLVDGNKLDLIFAKKIESKLLRLIQPGIKYLILSDNKELKIYLSKWPMFIIQNNNIAHLGNTNASDEGVKNTLLDLFLIARSGGVISLSVYTWGSGFSEWTSRIFGVPFIKRPIDFEPSNPKEIVQNNFTMFSSKNIKK